MANLVTEETKNKIICDTTSHPSSNQKLNILNIILFYLNDDQARKEMHSYVGEIVSALIGTIIFKGKSANLNHKL